MSGGPIYLGGLAHSGKTPLRAALNAHPWISITRKTSPWTRFYGRFGDLTDRANLDRCLAALVADDAVATLEPDAGRVRAELADGPVSYARLFGLLQAHHAERQGCSRWGEQARSIERFADPIFEAYPDARMIHLIRDPRDGFGASPRRGPGTVGWHTAMWRRSAELAERNRGRYPHGYLAVRYEALVADPGVTLEQVCSFIDEACLPAMREALLEGLHAKEVDLGTTPAQRAFVDRYAGPALPAFDYPAATATVTNRDRVSFALASRPLNRATMAAWRLVEGRAGREPAGR